MQDGSSRNGPMPAFAGGAVSGQLSSGVSRWEASPEMDGQKELERRRPGVIHARVKAFRIKAGLEMEEN